MSIRRIITFGLSSLVILSLVFATSSCNSRMAVCHANSTTKAKKMKKNKSSYNVKYSFKSKPVRKTYVIRNGKR